VLLQPSLNFARLVPRYALPFVAVTAAGVGSIVVPVASVGIHNVFFFFAAIVITAWYAGAGPGWLSVALSGLTTNSFFESPDHRFVLGPEGLSWSAAFVLCGAVTIATSFRRRRAEEAFRRAHGDLEGRICARTRELLRLNERLIAEVAERVRTETALRQTQSELARAHRLITLAELSASIAHEINQPLAAVVSNGEAAKNWLRRSPPALPAAAESIQAAVTAAARAAEIVTRIRSLITKAIPRQTYIEVNELVGEVLTLANADLTNRQIVAECRLAAALPSIIGDRVQLQEMLLNVVNNASDAMADVSDRKRELIIETATHSEDAISIVVSDSGHGLCAADPSKMFRAFYSTKAGGMGIGLSVCRTIVEQHGGSIRAMTRQPHGAILKIDLPVARSHD
jgi:C4-dicarboxylate-specific signal transduction histidine kinase